MKRKLVTALFLPLLLILLQQAAIAGNNICTGAIVIPFNTTVTDSAIASGNYTTYYANGCTVPDSTCGCNKNEAWYKFTSPVAGIYKITVTGNGTATKGFDPVLEFRQATCNGNLLLGLNVTGRGDTEKVSISVPAGTTYNLRVYNYYCNDSLNNSFTIRVDAPPCVVPAVTVNTSGTYCGQTTLLASSASANDTIYFQGTTSGGTSTAIQTSAQIITTSGTYYFRSKNGTCWSPQGSATVTITGGPCLQWLNQNCTTTTRGSYIDGGTISPIPVLQTASMNTDTSNYGYVFWTFNASADSTYYFDLCSSPSTAMSRLRLHNARNTTPTNNYCMDTSSTPTLVLENTANGCAGTGTGLSKLIWTCPVSGTYYLESAGDYMTYWGVLKNDTATLSYKTIPSSTITCTDVFYDKGIDGMNGSSNNYNNNESWTYTYFPLDTVADAINVQFISFSTSPGDILCVYDGNSINAPMIGCYSGPSITGAFSSTANDGSLTFQFTSDDSLISGGWEANVSCVASLGVSKKGFVKGISIYPSPAGNKLIIQFSETGKGKNAFQIYDVTGREISTQQQTSNLKPETTIDISSLQPGVYFLKINEEENSMVKRFLKE